MQYVQSSDLKNFSNIPKVKMNKSTKEVEKQNRKAKNLKKSERHEKGKK